MTFENARTWCAAFFATLVAVVAGFAALNYSIDFYGLFHPERHAPVRLYSNERTGKYLLGLGYIPHNFGAILIGSSISENWPITDVAGLPVYNISLSGGNATEERLILDNVLRSGHPSLAIVCIHPYITASHGRKSAYMNPGDYWGALGSIPLLREYAGAAVAARHGTPPLADEHGVNHFEATGEPDPRVAALRERATPAGPIRPLEVDEIAVREYADMLAALRARGTRIVGFIPPIYGERLRVQAGDYARYYALMRALFVAGEPVYDFNAPEYARLTEASETFYDGAHLSAPAAAFFAAELVRLVEGRPAAEIPQPVVPSRP